jgi:hypothetical protein
MQQNGTVSYLSAVIHLYPFTSYMHLAVRVSFRYFLKPFLEGILERDSPLILYFHRKLQTDRQCGIQKL